MGGDLAKDFEGGGERGRGRIGENFIGQSGTLIKSLDRLSIHGKSLSNLFLLLLAERSVRFFVVDGKSIGSTLQEGGEGGSKGGTESSYARPYERRYRYQ